MKTFDISTDHVNKALKASGYEDAMELAVFMGLNAGGSEVHAVFFMNEDTPDASKVYVKDGKGEY